MFGKKKAISPLIATIILIAICVVGGLLIYNVFYSTSGILSAKGQISVETVDLVKDTDGNVVFSITLKNTGNKPANGTTVTLNGEAAADVLSTGETLEPGKSAVYTATSEGGDLEGEYTIGNVYNVVIEAEFPDGSAFVTTTSVMCRYG